MAQAFDAVLQLHRQRYPLATVQDLAKLAYQNEFGPEHFIAGAASVLPGIVAEWRALPPGAHGAGVLVEDIGNGLCRFPLCALRDEAQCALLAALFAQTAHGRTGTRAGLLQKLQAVEAAMPEGAAWLAAYRAAGCPPVHHSEAYRRAYAPHYRLLAQGYARRLLA